MGAVPITPEQRAVVAAAVAHQIDRLGTTAESVAKAAGLSGNTVRAVVAAKSWPQASSRGRMELALGWTPGSFERILRGDSERTGLEGYSDLDLVVEQLRRVHVRNRRAGR